MVADVSPLTGAPTMNSWPIRCAGVISLKAIRPAAAAAEFLVVAAKALTEPAGPAAIATPVRAVQVTVARMDLVSADIAGLP